MLSERCLETLTCAAVFSVYWRFNYNARPGFVGGFRYFNMNVAVFTVHADVLDERLGDMEDLKFAARAGSVGRQREVLWPRKQCVECDRDRREVRYRDMLCCVAVIGDSRTKGKALAKVGGLEESQR